MGGLVQRNSVRRVIAAALRQLMDVCGIQGSLAVDGNHPVTGQRASIVVSWEHTNGELGVTFRRRLFRSKKARGIGGHNIIRWHFKPDETVEFSSFLRLEVLCDECSSGQCAEACITQTEEKRNIELSHYCTVSEIGRASCRERG